MIRRILSIALALPLACAAVPMQAQDAPATAPAKPAAAVHAPAQVDPGERVYQANCARCHSAPEELSRRMTPTVVMHMRVRANLSARDQQLLVKYFAP